MAMEHSVEVFYVTCAARGPVKRLDIAKFFSEEAADAYIEQNKGAYAERPLVDKRIESRAAQHDAHRVG